MAKTTPMSKRIKEGIRWNDLTAGQQMAAERAGFTRARYPDAFWLWLFDVHGNCTGVRDNGETFANFFSVKR